jgi:pSer/pThr/pTyr-binding forkhead associated (FHA) protein
VTIRLIDSAGEAVAFTLLPGGSVTIGRAPLADIRVLDLSAGRYVVRLTRTGEGVRVDDLDSGGGSSLEVNGTLTPRPHCLLPDGATLRIGQVAFRIELSSPERRIP